jgi:hypothetical protein
MVNKRVVSLPELTTQTKPNKETVGRVIVAAVRFEPSGLNVLVSRDGRRERMQLLANAKIRTFSTHCHETGQIQKLGAGENAGGRTPYSTQYT